MKILKEQYEYEIARSYLRGADFLEMMSKTNKANASIFPSWNINRATLMLDSQVVEYISITTRVNGYQMLGELNESLLKTYKEQLDTSYQEIQKGELYEHLILNRYPNIYILEGSVESRYNQMEDSNKKNYTLSILRCSLYRHLEVIVSKAKYINNYVYDEIVALDINESIDASIKSLNWYVDVVSLEKTIFETLSKYNGKYYLD